MDTSSSSRVLLVPEVQRGTSVCLESNVGQTALLVTTQGKLPE